MKHPIQLSLLSLLLLVGSAIAEIPARDPFAKPDPGSNSNASASTGNLMYRVRMFALPTSLANDVIDRPELKNNTDAVLKSIAGMVSERRARVVANPVIVAKAGEHVTAEGAATFEIDGSLGADGKTVKFIMIVNYKGGGKLRLESKLKAGSSGFVGTIDLPGSQSARETCLVFLTIQ